MGLFSSINNEDIPLKKSVSSNFDDRFRLISTLISTPDCLSEGAKKFRSLENLIKTDFLRLSAGIGLPGESVLYAELLAMLADLREVVEFPHLANKNILAVGGEFSAGKSCFLNAVFGMDELLPTGINPTTSIPTFLTNGNQESIRALNAFHRTQILSREELNSISHAFNDKITSTQSRISFYHILKLLQVESPAMRWKNIAFLDTPGYSKPHSDDADNEQGSDAGNTDEEKAREHLSNADYLIWVVGAKDGTFQQQGISFLRDKVKWNRPLYLLINKADQLLNEEDVNTVYSTICQKAKDAGFVLAGASAFSSRTGRVFCGDDPVVWFNEIDKKCKYTRWRGRFKQVIDKVIQYNTELEQHCSAYEMLLNRISTKEIGLTENESEKVMKLKTSISAEKKKHADAIRPFVVFCEKVEQKLEETLAEIGIKDEQAKDVGLEAISIDDKALLKLKKGDIVYGEVEIYSRFSGYYIKSLQANNQIFIRKKDIDAVITNPEKTFAVGRPVELTVYEISFSQKRVVLTVNLSS